MSEWSRANKEKCRAHSAKWYAANKDKARAKQRRQKGIIDATGERRVGPCESCRKHSDPLQCDHDHTTGLTRGWLCIRCNVVAGVLENPETLNTLRYLNLKGTKCMPSFRDALKNYKTTTAAAPSAETVPVNPPEAPAIMETKTVPETEGVPEPKAAEPEKKARAPRGSKSKSTEPTASIASVPATVEPASAVDELALSTEALVAELRNRGYAVTLVAAG
jgi:hypothetical protein